MKAHQNAPGRTRMHQDEGRIFHGVLCAIVAGALALDWCEEMFSKHGWVRDLASLAAAAGGIALAWCLGRMLGAWMGGGA